MNVIEQKKVLRTRMVEERKQLSAASKSEYDRRICDSLKAIVQDRKCKVVHCYIPMRGEINIIKFIEFLLEEGVTVVAPKTLAKRKLKNLILQSLSKLEKGVFGTVHPAGDHEYKGEYDLIVVPGLAYDNDLYRLGYGGGYYDGFLSEHKRAKKIGICYPFQLIDKVPREDHDIQLDEVLCLDDPA